ncbi:hypothetical protein [Streptosporangium sp. CA-115845]|uniref:hypothetical protein n=1 Tax=Streptosporangium sp. CA-115845 TaxID=3240071 RepID=UPI003D8CD87D
MTFSKLRAVASAVSASAKASPRVWQPVLAATVYGLTITCSGLLYGTAGVFIAWVCLGVGAALGFVAGLDFDRTQRTGPWRRLERECAEQAERLALVEAQNVSLQRLLAQAKKDLVLATQTSEGHYAEILRLRAATGETP